MYVGEFLLWFGSAIKAETRKKLKMGYTNGDMTLKEVQKDYTQESVSNNPRPIGPYYAYNNRYLEIRGGMFENFRGVLSWISLLIFLIPYSAGYAASYIILDLNNYKPEEIASGIFAIIFFSIIFLILAYLCIRYFRYIYRFELFTLRHIRVRFNRITRQVYIQRPKYCGGTVVFKWEHIMPANFGETGSDMGGTNMVNLMTFHPYKTGFPVAQSVGIGKNTYNPQDYKDEWEFIRRYMEHGPDNLPKPRLSTHLPMPFHGFEGHIKPMIHAAKNAPTVWVYLLLIPVFLILPPFYTVGYFISECLCWQPRWPKVIRQAGQMGKPIPKETTLADYPPKVQQALLDSRLEWGVRDENTGKRVDYGNS
ncbi:hypothetical protein A9G45_00885 [Gilliamella sp. HK2]|uniref:DUF6708 domain-containing protein n=1 Tax=unclassified Gilliamella TaxID=2685620 RepID=UPI00080EABBF|nr:DUF6708 domain-containing protein [Gilliamella apicola]OCG23237.1 hypothetical protein A9G46_10620 [Gilliamella apicola]OCG32389.1 hypothetical protein A9G45_00885 [Gilliamella apicola]